MSVYNVFEIDYEDRETFQMIKEGKTTLVFQLESNLLRHWSKKFAPESVMEVAALTAVVRPGVLNTVDENNISAADHIVKRKHGEESAVPIHPILSNSLRETWQALLYQESLLPLCKDVANWDSDKALDLLKAVAKKKMDLIMKYKKEFVSDATAFGSVTEVEATKIYESLEASGRYLFSKNHCLSPDTIVETLDGLLKTLEDVKIGDFVKTTKGRYVEVLDKFNNGYKECWEITLESGKTITCTDDHKFLCENGEIIPLKEILNRSLKIVCEAD